MAELWLYSHTPRVLLCYLYIWETGWNLYRDRRRDVLGKARPWDWSSLRNSDYDSWNCCRINRNLSVRYIDLYFKGCINIFFRQNLLDRRGLLFLNPQHLKIYQLLHSSFERPTFLNWVAHLTFVIFTTFILIQIVRACIRVWRHRSDIPSKD